MVNDDDLAPASITAAIAQTIALAIGTGAEKVNQIYAKRRSLAATTAENLDLAGSLTNPLGSTITFTKVRVILVYLRPGANTGPLLVGGHATGALATMFASADTLDNDQPRIRIRNGVSGGILLLTGTDSTGYAVAAGTRDILKIENEGSATASYDIYILGE
jgi:hypothetical protein